MDTRPPRNASDRPFQKPDPIASLIELDLDVMKLLARRAKLLVRLRGGKDHAATPKAVKAEKEVRAAWERNAVRFSRDAKFSRQLFSLLQELSIDSQEESESRGGFNLAPARRPVAVTLPAPVSLVSTRLWASLAAAWGDALHIDNVMLNDSLLAYVKALNQVGAHFTWNMGGRSGEGSLSHARRDEAADSEEPALRFPGAVLYTGEDTLTLYLLAFLALPHTGKVRFTGGSGLKMADLSALRRFLPSLGARFAHTVPGSRGLPASLEISGVLPEHVMLPADLPLEAIWAFLCAACAWNKRITVDMGALPTGVMLRVLAEVLPLLRACGRDDFLRGAELTLSPRPVTGAGAASLPGNPVLAADPALCAYLLALPAFAGGEVTLSGTWPSASPLADEAALLLSSAGLVPRHAVNAVRTDCANPATLLSGVPTPLDLREVDPALLPLGLALAVSAARRAKAAYSAPLLPEVEDAALAADFCARFGLVFTQDGMLTSAPVPIPEDTDGAPAFPASQVPWTSPNPYWTFAYALCAYVQPHVQLTNPAIITELMPSFWALYNALPNPLAAPVKVVREETAKPKTARRRIVSERTEGEEA